MADTTLRSLAKAYSKKTIEQGAYREARAKFLNGVLAGEIALSVNDYPSLIRPKTDPTAETTLRRQEKKSPPISETPSEPGPQPVKKNKWLLIGAAAAVVLLIIIGIIIFSVGDDQDTPATAEEPQVAQTQTQPNDAQLLVRDFLTQRNWASDTSLDTFLTKWQSLSPETRSNATGTLELNQLTNAIYKELLEERALSSIGNTADSTRKQQKLIDFAQQIGLNDPRISLPK